MTTIEALKLDTEDLELEEYMALTESQRANIKSIKIVPPRLSGFQLDDDFGKIKVKYKTPMYKAS